MGGDAMDRLFLSQTFPCFYNTKSSIIPARSTSNWTPYRLLLVALEILVLRPSSPLDRISSPLARTLSTCGRELVELLLRRRRRTSSGSPGDSPLARASRLSTSVKLTTPDSRPDMPAPGS